MTPPDSASGTAADLAARAGDPTLDAIARLAGYIAGGSAAGVHVLDEKVQHRIGGYNAPIAPHPREDSMCRLVVESGERIATSDATGEDRFATGAPDAFGGRGSGADAGCAGDCIHEGRRGASGAAPGCRIYRMMTFLP